MTTAVRSIRRTLVLFGLALTSWLLVAGVVAPRFVRAGYNGRSIGVVNRFFSMKQQPHPLDYYLGRLETMTAGGAALIVVLALCALAMAADRARDGRWSRRWIGVAPPEALAGIRIVVLSITFGLVLFEDLPSSALLPRSLLQFQGQGVISVLSVVPGYSAFMASHTSLLVFKSLLLMLLGLGTLGLAARWVLPLCFVGYLIFGGMLRQYFHFFHFGLLPLYLLGVLAATPCADAWSVDRWMRERRGQPVPSLEARASYAWARWTIWAVIGLAYFSAGVSKLRNGGLFWWDPTSLRSIIVAAALDPMQFEFPFGLELVHVPDWIVAAFGISTLIVEIGMISVVFSRRARLIVPPLAGLMHVGILLTQNIPFLDLVVLPLVFLHPHHLARAVAAAFRRSGEALVHLRRIATDHAWFAPSPPESSAPPATGLLPLGLLSALTAYALLAAMQIEYYPITAWQMFSHYYPSSSIRYIKFLERSADGSFARARPEREVGVLWDARYRDVLRPFVTSGDRTSKTRLDELLSITLTLRNSRLRDAPPVVGYSVQHWEWDWRARPDDSHYGVCISRYDFVPDISRH